MTKANDSKNIIYVEVDDEITGLIDKIRKLDSNQVSLVLPKRATLLQSLVNVKLLKHSVEKLGKSLAIISSDPSIKALSALAKIPVANNLLDTPTIPKVPVAAKSHASEAISESLAVADMTETSLKRKSDLEKLSQPNQTSPDDYHEGSHVDLTNLDTKSKVETLDLDSLDNDEAKDSPVKAEDFDLDQVNSAEKIKIPNFKRFIKWFIILVLLAAIVFAILVYSLNLFAEAKIVINTNATSQTVTGSLTLDTQSQSVDTNTGDIPAKQQTIQKSYSKTVNASGQQNNGQVASGTVTMSLEDCSPYNYSSNSSTFPSFTIPAGTGLSYNNQTYITQNDTILTAQPINKSACIPYTANGPTSIDAQNPGAAYNTGSSPVSFSVNGYAGVQATGTASGGTDNIVSVVTQADIQSAQNSVSTGSGSTAQQDLASQLTNEGYFPIEATFSASQPTVSANQTAGSVANSVTVSEQVTYSMYGVYTSDLKSIISAEINSQAGKKQNIISYGIYQSSFKVQSASNNQQVSLSTVDIIGPNLNKSQIQTESKDKSANQIINNLKNNPNITSVTVNFSPFWVTKAPTNTSKINVVISQPSSHP